METTKRIDTFEQTESFETSALLLYRISVEYPDVSGFEVLELLDTRSKLAEIEDDLTEKERRSLERADEILLDNLECFYNQIKEIGNLAEIRKQSNILPSHWWWYLDKFVDKISIPAKIT